MKYKLLLISGFVFLTCGFFLGIVFNGNILVPLSIIILSITNLFFIALGFTAIGMLKRRENKVKEALQDGYREGVNDIIEGVRKEFGQDAVNKVAQTSMDILAKNKEANQ